VKLKRVNPKRWSVNPARSLSVPLVCILLALACKGDSNNVPFDYSARMFVADEDSSGLFLCFATDSALAPGTPVTVVFTGIPQHFAAGRLAARKRLPCIPTPEQRGDTVTIAIDRGRPPVRFGVCAGTEGLHATAWAGAPLLSPRVWHAYYYLGYDVDPTCSEAEYTDSTGKSG
jgi:hypothetical protein